MINNGEDFGKRELGYRVKIFSDSLRRTRKFSDLTTYLNHSDQGKILRFLFRSGYRRGTSERTFNVGRD